MRENGEGSGRGRDKPSDCKADETVMRRGKESRLGEKSLRLHCRARTVLAKLRVCPQAPFFQELACLGSLRCSVWLGAACGEYGLAL